MLSAEGFRHEGLNITTTSLNLLVIGILLHALRANPLESPRTAPTADFLQTNMLETEPTRHKNLTPNLSPGVFLGPTIIW